MQDLQTEGRFYNGVYSEHQDGSVVCSKSVHSRSKAIRRVRQTLKYFALDHLPGRPRVLDVGCGLGYYSDAFASLGADVTGIDISSVAIHLAKATFPHCDFRCASYPSGVSEVASYDIIWAVDLSLLNTFNVDDIQRDFLNPSLRRLKPNGVIIVGWHTDFSGTDRGNWAHWSVRDLRNLRDTSGVTAYGVVETRHRWASLIAVGVCRLLRKSAPIFFVKRRGPTELEHAV